MSFLRSPAGLPPLKTKGEYQRLGLDKALDEFEAELEMNMTTHDATVQNPLEIH